MNIYKINNEKFKSVYFSCNYTLNCKSEDISYLNVVASILGKSNNKYKTQKDIEEYLYSLYGASFDVNVEKIGDLFNVEFKLEFINPKFLPGREDITERCIEFIYDMIYNSALLSDDIDLKLVEREKESVLEKILTRKDDKLKYAVNKTEEILCKSEPFGTFIYGDEDIVRNASLEDIKRYYKKLTSEALVTVILSGNLSDLDDIDRKINDKFKETSNVAGYDDFKVDSENVYDDKCEELSEKLDSSQSVITIGMRIKGASKNDFFALNVYNAVLGATPSSKLFQNFREKESLAYTVRSRYYRYKNIILIYAGIEYKNYEKAKEVLKKEINDMKLGNISSEEFEAAKESLIADITEIEDSKVSMAKMLISNLFYYKNNDMTVEKMIEGIRSVSLSDVIDVANKIDLNLIYLLGGEESV